MDSYDRDDIVDKLEVMLSDLYDIGDEFGEDLNEESLDFLNDAKTSLELARSSIKDIVCEDDGDNENVYDEEEM